MGRFSSGRAETALAEVLVQPWLSEPTSLPRRRASVPRSDDPPRRDPTKPLEPVVVAVAAEVLLGTTVAVPYFRWKADIAVPAMDRKVWTLTKSAKRVGSKPD